MKLIGFVASSISTKSSLSATSPRHGGGVLGGPGTGPTRTDLMHIPIHPTTPATQAIEASMVTVVIVMAMVMDRPAMITDMFPRL